MSTIKTTYIQHPSAASPNLELAADGTVVLPLSDLEDLANVSGSPTDGQVLAYDSGTSAWNPTDPPGGFDSSVTITATDASWSVPATPNGIFRVTVIGGGGGGGDGNSDTSSNGTNSAFGSGAAYEIEALGGNRGRQGQATASATSGLAATAWGAGGQGSIAFAGGPYSVGATGSDGQMRVGYVDLTGISTVNVVIGAGGNGDGGATDGIDGVVIVEYKAA